MNREKTNDGAPVSAQQSSQVASPNAAGRSSSNAESNKADLARSLVGALSVGPDSKSDGLVYIENLRTSQVVLAPQGIAQSSELPQFAPVNTVELPVARSSAKPTYMVAAPQRFSYMQTLVDKYKREMEQNPSFREVVEALQHYIARMDRGKVKGLQTKLTLAGWDDSAIIEAIRLKELFGKKLQGSLLSESAQHILVHLLGLLHLSFTETVPPMVAKGASLEAIQAAVVDKIIRPALAELDENVLNIHIPEIRGALFFLTGNCHIEWHNP